MSKFTIFTVILSISVIVVTADLAVRNYVEGGQASVLFGGDVSPVLSDTPSPVKEEASPAASPSPSEPAKEAPSESSETPEQKPYVLPPPSATITQELVQKAGFTGAFREQHFNGKLFQLLDITKTPVEAISSYTLEVSGAAVVSITEIALRDEIRALQLYSLLQNKTKPYIDLSLNETNSYGDRSFYINHAKKQDEAFLAVKIGKMLYAFAYIKEYHPQVAALLVLLHP